jgi:hypothetical protein
VSHSSVDPFAASGRADFQLAEVSEESERIKQVVVAGVLAALSIAVAPVASMLTRLAGWGIALFDPVSLFWIAAFLIGGIRVGMVSTGAGTIGLFFFDPTGIGPMFKFAATAPMILIPWLGVKKFGRGMGGKFLSRPLRGLTYGNYAVLMILAFIVRLLLMIPLNLAIVPIIAPFFTPDQIIAYTLTINAFQSVWDAAVPFIVVFPSTVFDHFKMW